MTQKAAEVLKSLTQKGYGYDQVESDDDEAHEPLDPVADLRAQMLELA
jgi:hypothetical protein